MDITRIESGKIVESWHQEGILGLMQQLGVIPTLDQLIMCLVPFTSEARNSVA